MVMKDPANTRKVLLEAAFWEMFRAGFQAASLEGIIQKAGVTKGALYHHFENKKALGLAVIDDVILPFFRERWFDPLRGAEDPIAAIQDRLRNFHTEVPEEAVDLGCPLNNFAQEMAPIDEDFRLRIDAIFDEWRAVIANTLRDAQGRGIIASSVDPNRTATFIIATYEGGVCISKSGKDPAVFESCAESVIEYLESLRAPRTPAH